MQENKKKKTKKILGTFQTAAFADIEKVSPVARVPMPSELSVSEAKNWVDENEK